MDDGEPTRVVALAWGAAAAPQRGPKRELTLERIVDAAVGLADAEGLAAVTMQRVAKTFGYTTMAMYRYVATKDDLHLLMVDAAAGEPIDVDDGDWRAGLEQWTRWMLDVYAAHPWMLDIPISMEALLMPGQMRIADAALRAMRTLPVSEGERLLLLMQLSTHARGTAVILRDMAGPAAIIAPATRALVREVATRGRFPDLAPLVASGLYTGDTPEGVEPSGAGVPPEDMAVGLRLLLDGIAATVERGDGVVPQPAPPTSPAEALELAEAELAAGIALRKATQRRVRDLERREHALRTARDAAKAAARAAAKGASSV